jgi:hypothetical protein
MSDHVLEPSAAALTKRASSFLDATQKLRMVLQSILEPIVLGCEPDQDACRSPMPGDDDLLFSRLPEILPRSLSSLAFPLRRATLALRPW